ncbi:electron transport protein [Novibacillus thermophilus]|uniref:Electron transport protein n=1 Tax=Novibacillus thermophilus TaxID=1471761 RepID=A0A1U9K845_9BACL|nr:electron transport protein [Novibacillus thermophilus]AQS56225.1 electron transport protein [Novibacillus thermophilus]
MSIKRISVWTLSLSGIVIVGIALYTLIQEPEFGYTPSLDQVLNVDRRPVERTSGNGISPVSHEEQEIEVTPRLLEMGRKAFYEETFGNEVFFTDIMGQMDGPINFVSIGKAVGKLRGKGTSNLQIELSDDVTVGGQTFKRGTLIDTGIDVPKGSYRPLGIVTKVTREGLKAGMTCAACHATVDNRTGKVIEGAPNSDLNAGLLMAFATNSAAYFRHTDVNPEEIAQLKKHLDRLDGSEAKEKVLPDVKQFEDAVDRTLMSWPAGNFDSTIDLEANPAQIPDSFTFGDFPYGWSGFASAGPFHGLSTFNNNVHATNSDTLTTADQSEALFGIDTDVYYGTVLQNAANKRYRYTGGNQRPSDFFKAIDPTPGVPGVVQAVPAPTFPKGSVVSPDALIVSDPGDQINEKNNAEAAWQNSLKPPRTWKDAERVRQGRDVFARAGCIRCHAGETLTNNTVISAVEIGTQPSRAKALQKLPKTFADPKMWDKNARAPVDSKAEVLRVPTDHIPSAERRLAYAQDGVGGYKVPSLVGLHVTAPYLHDGGVAAGPQAVEWTEDEGYIPRIREELGLTGTVLKGRSPDVENSLAALVDRGIRREVVRNNRASDRLATSNVTGAGHAYWVDSEAGFTPEEQKALVEYLMSLDGS